VAGPLVWNSLPAYLRAAGRYTFPKHLKTFLFTMYWYIQHIRSFTMMCYIDLRFTYLLTYFDKNFQCTGISEVM